MFIRIFLIAITCMHLSACASLLAPKVEQQITELKRGTYNLDTSHATLLFKVQHLGLSTYVGRFNGLAASLEFDPEQLESTRLTAQIDMNSLDINNPSLEQDLKGGQWFDTARFPAAEFRTLSVKPVPKNTGSGSVFEFTGELSWRGVSKPIVLKVIFHGGANNILTGKYTLGFSAFGSFKRSDFGMDAYTPLVGDEIELEAFAEFQRD